MKIDTFIERDISPNNRGNYFSFEPTKMTTINEIAIMFPENEMPNNRRTRDNNKTSSCSGLTTENKKYIETLVANSINEILTNPGNIKISYLASMISLFKKGMSVDKDTPFLDLNKSTNSAEKIYLQYLSAVLEKNSKNITYNEFLRRLENYKNDTREICPDANSKKPVCCHKDTTTGKYEHKGFHGPFMLSPVRCLNHNEVCEIINTNLHYLTDKYDYDFIFLISVLVFTSYNFKSYKGQSSFHIVTSCIENQLKTQINNKKLKKEDLNFNNIKIIQVDESYDNVDVFSDTIRLQVIQENYIEEYSKYLMWKTDQKDMPVPNWKTETDQKDMPVRCNTPIPFVLPLANDTTSTRQVQKRGRESSVEDSESEYESDYESDYSYNPNSMMMGFNSPRLQFNHNAKRARI